MLDEIAKEMHFSYILEIGPDNSQGKVNEKTGKWDGLMGELQELVSYYYHRIYIEAIDLIALLILYDNIIFYSSLFVM